MHLSLLVEVHGPLCECLRARRFWASLSLRTKPLCLPRARRRSQSRLDVLEYRDTYGQAQVCSKGHQGSSVDRPCQPSFHWTASGKYRIRYLRVFDYVSVSQCATGLARESEVFILNGLRWKNKPRHLSLLYDEFLSTELS